MELTTSNKIVQKLDKIPKILIDFFVNKRRYGVDFWTFIFAMT